MGVCVSRRSSNSSFNKIRVVHFNGFVQHFGQPVSVLQLTGKPPTHFVCTAAQLVSGSGKPALSPGALLEPGKVYLMLPFSTLHSDVSSVDLASIAKKLTAAAKGGGRFGSGRGLNCPAANACPERSGCRNKESWRPILDTVKERSESDLQEKHGRWS